jgi:hypothetical protein
MEILASNTIFSGRFSPNRPSRGHHPPRFALSRRRMSPTTTLPCLDEAESMCHLTFFVSPRLARRLIDSSPHFIAETGGVKLHHRPPTSRPLRSARRPIKGTPSTAAPQPTAPHPTFCFTSLCLHSPNTERHHRRSFLFVVGLTSPSSQSPKTSVRFPACPSLC